MPTKPEERRKSVPSIQREIRALKQLSDDVQANAMRLALEWSLGQWGMNWSHWLKACQRGSIKARHVALVTNKSRRAR